jgi:hypothetical protein
MKRLILFSVVMCLTSILAGCSFLADVVIVNNSNDFLQISYQAKTPNYGELTPRFAPLSEFSVNRTEWRELSEERYKIDNETGTVEVRLAPHEALNIKSIDAGRAEDNPDKALNLKSLQIASEKGSIILEGDQIYRQFKPEHRGLVLFGPRYSTYVLYYDEQKNQ